MAVNQLEFHNYAIHMNNITISTHQQGEIPHPFQQKAIVLWAYSIPIIAINEHDFRLLYSLQTH